MKKVIKIAKNIQNEIPIAAMICKKNTDIIAAYSINTVEKNKNPIEHAEMNVIKLINKKYLYDYDIYINLQPCNMCSGALYNKRINNIFFGAYRDEFLKLENNTFGGIMQYESEIVLQEFFMKIRNNKKNPY